MTVVISSWLHLTFLLLQNLRPGQVIKLTSNDFIDTDRMASLLQKANPDDPMLRKPGADYKTDRVRVIIITKAVSVGVDGLRFIKHLVGNAAVFPTVRLLQAAVWQIFSPCFQVGSKLQSTDVSVTPVLVAPACVAVSCCFLPFAFHYPILLFALVQHGS